MDKARRAEPPERACPDREQHTHLLVAALEAHQILTHAEGLRALRVARDDGVHLAHALLEELQLRMPLGHLLLREDLLLVRERLEVLLHAGVDRLEPLGELLVVAHELALDVAPLRLEGGAVLEQLVHAPAVAVVRRREVLRLLEHLVHFAMRSRAVEQQVVIGELALQSAHVVGERLVLALELAVRRVVLLALLDRAL